MRFSIAALLSAVTLASAAPQSGGSFVSVGNKYSGGGCNPSTLIFADPIFGNGNVCQPLDRSGTGVPIVSYETLSVQAGCTVKLYSSSDCTGTAYIAPVNGCVQGNAPFVSTFVQCS